MAFFAFLIFTAFVTLLADSILDVGDALDVGKDWKPNDFENDHTVSQFAKCVYLSFMGYVSCGPANTPSSVPARLAAVGFGWFLLVFMASYTANLASIFTITQSRNEINSIEDVIAKELTICAYGAVAGALSSIHPGAKVDGSYSDWGPMLGAFHRGKCDVVFCTEKVITSTFNGRYAAEDCTKMDGGMTAEDAEKQNVFCVRDPSGDPDLMRDCSSLVKVGSKVMTVR